MTLNVRVRNLLLALSLVLYGLTILPPAAVAHPGQGGGAIDAFGALQGEDYDTFSGPCDPTFDGEHVNVWSRGSAREGYLAWLPQSTCEVRFKAVYVPADAQVVGVRGSIGGSTGSKSINVDVHFSGSLVASGTISHSGGDTLQDFALSPSGVLPAGSHFVNVTYQTQSGTAAWHNFLFDCLQLDFGDGHGYGCIEGQSTTDPCQDPENPDCDPCNDPANPDCDPCADNPECCEDGSDPTNGECPPPPECDPSNPQPPECDSYCDTHYDSPECCEYWENSPPCDNEPCPEYDPDCIITDPCEAFFTAEECCERDGTCPPPPCDAYLPPELCDPQPPCVENPRDCVPPPLTCEDHFPPEVCDPEPPCVDNPSDCVPPPPTCEDLLPPRWCDIEPPCVENPSDCVPPPPTCDDIFPPRVCDPRPPCVEDPRDCLPPPPEDCVYIVIGDKSYVICPPRW